MSGTPTTVKRPSTASDETQPVLAGWEIPIADLTVADVLEWSAQMQLPGGDQWLSRLSQVRTAAFESDDALLAAAAAYVESAWCVEHSPPRGRCLLLEAMELCHSRGEILVATTLAAFELYLSETPALEQIDRLSSVAALLETTPGEEEWRIRGLNLIALLVQRAGLPSLAAEMFDRVVEIGDGLGDLHLAGAAASNRRRAVVDHVLWCVLMGRPIDQRLLRFAAPSAHSTDHIQEQETRPSGDAWIWEAHAEIVVVLLDPDAPTDRLIEMLDRTPQSHAVADATDIIGLVLAHRALKRSDPTSAEAYLAAIDARATDRGSGERRHLVAWLRAKILAEAHPETAGPVLAHAADAWRFVDDQRRMFHQSMKSRIESETHSLTRARLAQQVLEDPLTGLGNRRAYEAASTPSGGAVLYVDVDAFKHVNDTFGHVVGDETLVRIAAVLRSKSRDGDAVCRIGGDEFVIVARDLCPDAAERRAKAIVETIREVRWDEVAAGLEVTVSIGLGCGPGDRESLAAAADKALYEVKSRGGADWHRRTVD